ncbi:MAG TPA: tripartite tricarboxylate transporter substrate binding protein [Burkholderiales bacterium]|nr:tripartite tricarboxylate transporter substrate binding protein [Burkholderiales bacterium]
MRGAFIVALLWLATPAAAAPGVQGMGAIELVNPFPAAGPHDINGSLPVNKVLRAMQDHAVPPVTDVLARSLQQSMTLGLDTNVSLVRRPRRNGIDAQYHAARAAPDGRTLLLGSTGSIIIQPLVARDAQLDPLRDLTPVALVARMPFVLIAAAGSRLRDVQAVMEAAQAMPGRLHLGSAGEFTISHLAGALLQRATGVMLHDVSFNGGAPASRGVLADQIELALLPLPAVLPYARNPKLRALAITDRERHAALPGVPTVVETGIPGAAYSAWYGVFAASATPGHLIDRIDAAIASERHAEPVRLEMSRHGLTATHLGAGRLREMIEEEVRLWKPFIDELKLR